MNIQIFKYFINKNTNKFFIINTYYILSLSLSQITSYLLYNFWYFLPTFKC